MDDADKLLAQLLTADEANSIYNGFGPDVAFLLDKVTDIYCGAGCKAAIPRHVRQRLFIALRQAIPDENLFDPMLGVFFWLHLRWLYKWAYLDPVPTEQVQ